MNPSGYVLTPHMKEMSRLTGYSVQELKDNRRGLLRKYTEKVHAVCVLKDSRTLVKAPEGRLMINTTGNAAMAKADRRCACRNDHRTYGTAYETG